jgi:Tfp pilus assembly protein PilF
MNPRRAALAAAFAALTGACAHAPAVERAYGVRVIQGRFIEPRAYAAFLRATLAEVNGDTKGALAAYGEAARLDPSAPEIWTRIGSVRCQADAHDPQADASFSRALTLEATYARAWAAKARCALSRGDLVAARTAARRATELDPGADGANVLLARTAAPERDAETRAALVALTVTARDRTVAWDALASWAEAHGDVALAARALRELARISPERREDVARAAEQLAGAGESSEAWGVAAAAADAGERPLGVEQALAARLAVDEAIARDDAGAVSARATRVRLPLDEAAGRALLAGKPRLARELASAIARADPTALGARLVLAASGGGDVLGAAYDARPHPQAVPAAAFVAFGIALVHSASSEHTRAVLAGMTHLGVVAGDDRVVRPAVELVSRGVLSSDALPPDGVVELAAQRGEAPPEGLLAPDRHALDARHEYLALALAHPESARARELATRFGTASADPLIAAASALVELATGAPIAPAAPRALLSRNPGDPVLAATALRLAEKIGNREVARSAREALTALGAWRGASVE